jgi:hypothetical protein
MAFPRRSDRCREHGARRRRLLAVELVEGRSPPSTATTIGSTPTYLWVGAKLRTNYGPRRPNSAHINGQPWTPASSGSRSTTVMARSGGQGVASSNLASPTSQCRIITPGQSAFMRPPAHPRLASAPGSWAQIMPTSASTTPRDRARIGDPSEDNARHRRVLMAGHVLKKVQLDAGVGYPGQRRVSQAVPHGAGQPEIINELVLRRRIAQGRGGDHQK